MATTTIGVASRNATATAWAGELDGGTIELLDDADAVLGEGDLSDPAASGAASDGAISLAGPVAVSITSPGSITKVVLKNAAGVAQLTTDDVGPLSSGAACIIGRTLDAENPNDWRLVSAGDTISVATISMAAQRETYTT